MQYLTLEDVSRLPMPLKKTEGDLLKEVRASVEPKQVFLSHSHLDEAALARIAALFQMNGAPVYLANQDSSLPQAASVDTAKGIREKIVQIPRLVVVSSRNLSTSRWVPWEIGIADGTRGREYVALVPLSIATDRPPAMEQEYLDMYPAVCWVTPKGSSVREVAVNDPFDGHYWPLKRWLSRESLT